jgi:hypothetical protein
VYECIWDSRGSYLADLEVHLTPFLNMLHREETSASINAYFVAPHDQPNDFPEWKADLIDVSDRDKLVDLLVKSMLAVASGKQTEESQPDLIGWPLLLRTSFPWREVDPKTRKALYTTLAKIAIIEIHRLKRYIKPIVTQTSIYHLRMHFISRLSPLAVAQYVNDKYIYKWNFYDQFKPANVQNVPPDSKLPFADRLLSVSTDESKTHAHDQIKKLIKRIESFPWATIDGEAGSLLEHNVEITLRDFIQV